MRYALTSRADARARARAYARTSGVRQYGFFGG